MKWFRFYSEVLNDPKVQKLPPATFKTWVNLLCLANEGKPRGQLPSASDIAFRLRLPESSVQAAIKDLQERGLLDEFVPHNWHERQPESDDAAERMRNKRRTSSEQTPNKFPLDKNREEENRTEEEQNRAEAEVDESAAAAFQAVQELIGTLNAFSRAEVDLWLVEYPPEWIPSACEEAAMMNVRNLKYVGAILQRWSQEGRSTAGDDEESEEEWVARTKAEFVARGMM